MARYDLRSIRGTSADPDDEMTVWAAISGLDGLTDIFIAAFAASVVCRTATRNRVKVVWYTPYLIRLG